MIAAAVMSDMVSDPGRTEPVGSIPEAIARMRAIEAALPPYDGVAAFNRMYLQITELVGEQLSVSLSTQTACSLANFTIWRRLSIKNISTIIPAAPAVRTLTSRWVNAIAT